MNRWDRFQIYRGNVDASIEELRQMSQRMEMVKDLTVGMEDVTEAIKRNLVILRQKRKLLEEVKDQQPWAAEMITYLEVIISDQDFVVSDLHTDIKTLVDGFIPNPYHYSRRLRSNVA